MFCIKIRCDQSSNYISGQLLSKLNATRLTNGIEMRKFQFQHRILTRIKRKRGIANRMSRTVSIYLQHPFRQASFLGKLLEILRIGIVIDREVALHRS